MKRTLLLAAAGLGTAWAMRRLIRQQRYDALQDRTVLITGGSRGLGLALARELVREGARLAICARDRDELDRARRDLDSRGGKVFPWRCDVTDQWQVEEMVKAVQERFGAIDVLINNAGVIEVGPVELMTLDDYEEALKTHFWGPLYTILSVLPHMKKRGRGRIVNISSIGGKISIPHLVPYSASKFALVGLSEGLRAELAKDGIVVTTVCPGLMRTGSPLHATFKGQHRAEFAWFAFSDALPFLSIPVEKAARRIIDACKHGDGEVILSLPAKQAVCFHGLFPSLTADILGLVNRMLPGPGGIDAGRLKGIDSESSLAPSWVKTATHRAALRNNELPYVSNGHDGRGI